MSSIEKLEKSMVKITGEIDGQSFEEALSKAYTRTRSRYTVNGFRKGKAPRSFIEREYGPLVFFDDAFDILWPEIYENAVKENGLEPVDRPDVSIEDIGEDKTVKYSATVAVMPEVTLGQYKGIEVVKREYNVTDEMVDAEIEKERENVARFVDIDRPVENGDTVNLDYSGSVDGVKFDGGTAEAQELVIGSGSFIPGFEEQLVGMVKGDEKDINVKFPDEYHSDELKGKDAVFAIRINGIQKKELPALDDEFAKDVSEFDTLEAFKADKRAKLTEQAEASAKNDYEDQLIVKMTDNATVEIPDCMIERQLDRMLSDFERRFAMQGISLDDYLKYTGGSRDDIRAEYKVEAERRVKTQLVMEAVTKAENVEATDDEIQVSIDEYAKNFGDNADKFLANLTDDDKDYFRERVVVDKTIALIKEASVPVEAKEADKEEAKAE